MPCLGCIYPKEPFSPFLESCCSVSISPAPLTMATLPWQWKIPTASSQASVCLRCALQPSGNIFQDGHCNPVHELAVCRTEPGTRCVEEMEFLASHNKADTEGLEHV